MATTRGAAVGKEDRLLGPHQLWREKRFGLRRFSPLVAFCLCQVPTYRVGTLDSVPGLVLDRTWPEHRCGTINVGFVDHHIYFVRTC